VWIVTQITVEEKKMGVVIKCTILNYSLRKLTENKTIQNKVPFLVMTSS